MQKLKKLLEGIVGSEDFSDLKSSNVRDILNGNILTKRFFQKQYGLVFMIAVLAFFYIDNRYYCENQIAEEVALKKKIQDLKYESLTISAELMQLSRQSNVMNMINERGIKLTRTTTPPIVVNDSTDEK